MDIADQLPQLKSCPFCGDQPRYAYFGSQVNIDCCSSFSRQKSDYLTREERHMTSREYFDEHHLNIPEIEIKVQTAVITEWNDRVEVPELATLESNRNILVLKNIGPHLVHILRNIQDFIAFRCGL